MKTRDSKYLYTIICDGSALPAARNIPKSWPRTSPRENKQRPKLLILHSQLRPQRTHPHLSPSMMSPPEEIRIITAADSKEGKYLYIIIIIEKCLIIPDLS
ncbi:hypothetical protein GDO81_021684 [Engystomops pustulosus]|uniref:Uncharacterized protein n=1 Tax=Engystomops pustulosus TaxID=76066 RepID=A0AAV6ZG71_ENGPU|nr:hypothetical protein GDO81_021684 [Engystomops pustulosus]